MNRSTAWTVALGAMVTLCATASACSGREDGEPEGSTGLEPDAASVGTSGGGSDSGSVATSVTDSGSGADAAAATCDIGGGSGAMCSSSVTAFVPCLTGSALLSPSVSFAKDVQPLLRSCSAAGAACHGSPSSEGATGLVYLGEPDGGTPGPDIVAHLVNQLSPEYPGMNLVEAGHPDFSFLMHKLDGDQCVLAAFCSSAENVTFANCGAQMPFNGPYLSQADRDTIRRWIAQGALP